MTEYELAQKLFSQQQAPDASMPTTSQVRGVAATDSTDGTVTVVLDATAGGADAEMEVPTTGGITEGSEVLVTLLDGAPVEVTQAGSIDGAAGSATKYITETGNYGIRVHPDGDTANYSEINANGMDVAKGGVNVAHFGETARLGAESGYHTEVTSTGMRVSDGTDDVVRIHSEVTQDGIRFGSIDIGKSGDGTLTSVGGSADDYAEGDDYVLHRRTANLTAMASTESDGAWIEAWAERASTWDEDSTGITLHGEQLNLWGQNGEGYASVSMEAAGKVISAQSGSVGQTTGIAANGYHDFDVTFPTEFATVPNVLLTIYTTTTATTFNCDIYLRAKSTTGFTARIVNRENATRAPGFQWLAMG